MNRPIPSWYRWELMLLLWCTYFLHQIDRAIFGVLTKNIQEDLHLTNTQIGLSHQLLFFVIAAMVPIAGFVGDRYSKKWIITISLLFWSAATMITGTARGLIGILLFRSIATGGGEAFYGPASTAMIAAFHKKTRAIALSIHQSAVYIAPMLSGFLGTFIAGAFGWRSVFYIFGGLGILMGVVLLFLLRETPEETEKKLQPKNETAEETVPFWEAVWHIVRIPTVLLLTVGFTAVVFVNNAYLAFAPLFIEERFTDITEMQARGYGMFMHFAAALIGVIVGGLLSDALVKRFPSFRIAMQATVMLLGAPMVFLIGYVGSPHILWIVLFIFGLLRGLYESNTHAAIFDVVPPKFRATVVALMLLAAMGIGSFAPTVFGYLGDRYGTAEGIALAFRLVSVVWILGGLCVLSALLFTFKKDRLKEMQ
jgi:MFS family permease